jgi:hypothetical protein
MTGENRMDGGSDVLEPGGAALDTASLPLRTFTMHTASGEHRVLALVDRVVSKNRTRREVVIMLRTGLMSIERRSPEVRNDSVRQQICRALDDYCDVAKIERVNCSEF